MSDANPEPLIVTRSSPAPWILVVLLLVAGGAGAFLLFDKLEASQGEAAAQKARAAEAQKKADGLAVSAEELKKALTELNDENKLINQDRQALERDVAAQADELSRLKGTYDALQDKMKAEIAKGDIELSQSGGKLRVDLVDKILFDSGEAQVSPAGEEVLQRLGAVLASIDDKLIQVAGHTDDTPISPKLVAQYPTNWELSSARAINVVRFMSEKAGVPSRRLVASGYGPYHPIATNSTPRGRARNRRIEIVLTPLMESVPSKSVAASMPGKTVATSAVAAPKTAVPAKATVKPPKHGAKGHPVARRN